MNKLSKIEKKLIEAVETTREELITLTANLVSIATENTPPGGGEIAGQKFIQNWLEGIGIDSELIELVDVKGLSKHRLFYESQGYERRDYSGRPNLAARMKGAGGGKTLILSGHIDTMPAGKTHWKHDPFGGEIADGKLYGRGSFDMKGGIAAELMALKILREAGIKLAGDVIFESVIDEEHAGCNGTLANRLIGYNGDAAVIPEPSNLQLYNAHKGFRIIHISLRGKSGMSFAGEHLPNPVEYVGLLIEGFKSFRDKRRKNAPKVPEYSDDGDPVPVFMNKLQAGEFSLNIPMQVPEECKLEIYWQTMPSESCEDIEKEFFDHLDLIIEENPALKQFKIEHCFSQRWMPGTRVESDAPIVRIIEKSASGVLGRPIKAIGAPYPCDLFVFNHFGIPGVIIGPSGENCHGSDEYVEIDSLVELTKIFLLSIVSFCQLA